MNTFIWAVCIVTAFNLILFVGAYVTYRRSRDVCLVPKPGTLWKDPEDLYEIIIEVVRSNERQVSCRIYNPGLPKQPETLTRTKLFLQRYVQIG